MIDLAVVDIAEGEYARALGVAEEAIAIAEEAGLPARASVAERTTARAREHLDREAPSH